MSKSRKRKSTKSSGAVEPKYPIYVLSKGRHKNCLTAKFLIEDNVDFRLVVEKQEYDEYASRYDKKLITVLPPESTGKGAVPVRNWIWEDSKKNGHDRHWVLDDNMHCVRRWYKKRRLACNAGIAFKVVEDFIDRYENIAIGGLNYTMFCTPNSKMPPVNLNVHVYSCLLIKNDIEPRWRGKWNADTDLCLQVLSEGWCTVLFNAFMVDKVSTMKMSGGNTDRYGGDGRLEMARSLERAWPHIVSTGRRFSRPQHIIKNAWRKFDTKLIRKKGINFDKMKPNEYGMSLKQVRPIKSKAIKKMLDDSNDGE